MIKGKNRDARDVIHGASLNVIMAFSHLARADQSDHIKYNGSTGSAGIFERSEPFSSCWFAARNNTTPGVRMDSVDLLSRSE